MQTEEKYLKTFPFLSKNIYIGQKDWKGDKELKDKETKLGILNIMQQTQ